MKPEVPFWETHSRFFGNKVPAETLAAWGQAWAAAGFTNGDMVRATLDLVAVPADRRPVFPADYINALELLMRRRVTELALAGKVDPSRLGRLAGQLEAEAAAAQRAAKEAGLALPDIETPELRRYRQIRDLAKRARSLALEAKSPSTRAPTLPSPVLAVLHDSTKTANG